MLKYVLLNIRLEKHQCWEEVSYNLVVFWLTLMDVGKLEGFQNGLKGRRSAQAT